MLEWLPSPILDKFGRHCGRDGEYPAGSSPQAREKALTVILILGLPAYHAILNLGIG